jgi:FkbM family methyltransferase
VADPSLSRQLEDLLARDPAAVAEASRARFDQAAGHRGHRIVLFGAGPLGRRTLAGMRAAGLSPPLAIADNNAALQGTQVEGVDVIAPAEGAHRFGRDSAFVISVYNTSRARTQLAALGVECVVPYAWLFARHPEALLPHGCLESPAPIFAQAEDVRRGFTLMADDLHRRLFLEQLRFRMFLDFDRVLRPQTQALRDSEYFPEDVYRYRDDEVLVDCGGFDGDTVRRFLRVRGDRFARIVPCEPDPDNFRRLMAWVEMLPAEIRSRIHPRNVAVGARREVLRFVATGTAGSVVGMAGTQEVQAEPIDEMLGAVTPTLIKVDTEGAEIEVITGARRSIAGAAPVFACTVYHASDHLWRVPLALHALQPRYRFRLRAHAEDCWDASCYAIPAERDPESEGGV